MSGATSAGELRYDTVTLLSDFGTADGFVGVVHSVIRQLCPGVGIVDLTHDIAPFDVRAASLVLARSIQFVCPGVIMAVVDPGVGTARRPVAIQVAGGRAVFVGPDNGVLAPAVGMIGGAERAIVLDNPEFHLPTAATTFDGRDVFAPVAAHLCAGIAWEDLGTAIDPALLTPGIVPLTRLEEGRILGEVLWVDRFGNCQLNIDPDEIDGWGSPVAVHLGDRRRTAHRIRAFAEVSTGSLGLLVDSDGLLSLVTDRGSAADELGLATGDQVDLEAIPDGEQEGDRAAVVTTSVELGRRSDAVRLDPSGAPIGQSGALS